MDKRAPRHVAGLHHGDAARLLLWAIEYMVKRRYYPHHYVTGPGALREGRDVQMISATAPPSRSQSDTSCQRAPRSVCVESLLIKQFIGFMYHDDQVNPEIIVGDTSMKRVRHEYDDTARRGVRNAAT